MIQNIFPKYKIINTLKGSLIRCDVFWCDIKNMFGNCNGNYIKINITRNIKRNCTVFWWITLLIYHSIKRHPLVKIVESVINFYFFKKINSIILNWRESFSGMVDHITCPPWGSYNFPNTRCFDTIFITIHLFGDNTIIKLWKQWNKNILNQT